MGTMINALPTSIGHGVTSNQNAGYVSRGGMVWSNPPPILPTGQNIQVTTGMAPMSSTVTPQLAYSSASNLPIPSSQQVPPANIPASYLPGPLTAALQHIAGSDVNQPGMNLRPEYFVLHKQEGEPIKNISHRSMSYRKLIHGMVLVARNMLSQGNDIQGYLRHMEYVTRHGKDGDYTDLAYAEYDKFSDRQFYTRSRRGY